MAGRTIPVVHNEGKVTDMSVRANGEGSIYARKDGRLVGQYRVDGKIKYVYGKNRTEVKEKLEKALDKVKNKIDFTNEKKTLNQWLDEWLNTYAKNGIKLSTYVSYEGMIRGHILEHRIGRMELGNLNTHEFQKYFNDKAVSGRADGKPWGLSPKTLSNHYNLLHAALDQALANDYIIKNPILSVRLPRQEHKEMRVLTVSEQMKMMNVVNLSDEIGACGINIALYTGMRLGEIIGLQWQDVDWNNRKISVNRTLNRLKTFDENSETATQIVISEPKTKNSIREIPMVTQLVDLLKKQYEKQKEMKGSIGRELPEDDFIVVGSALKFYEPKTYQEFFERYVEKSGIDKANFHATRHTFATRCIENGMDIVVLSKILGHANPSTTLNKYGHALQEQKKASMERMEDVYAEMVMKM